MVNLLDAAKTGDVNAIDLLLKAGADVNQVNEAGWSAFMYAAAKGRAELVSLLLLEHGVNVNQTSTRGMSALMAAIDGGHVDVIKLLLEHGANVNQTSTCGMFALMYAAVGNPESNRQAELVSLLLLLAKELDVNQENKKRMGMSVLMFAACDNQTEVIEALVKHPKIDVNQTDNDGASALMYAAHKGHVGAVELLLKAGADVNQVNEKRSSALSCAAKHGHVDVVLLLAEWINKEKLDALMSATRMKDQDSIDTTNNGKTFIQSSAEFYSSVREQSYSLGDPTMPSVFTW